MAKAILSAALAGLRGRLDGMVFRLRAGQTVVAPRPQRTSRAGTPARTPGLRAMPVHWSIRNCVSG